MTVDEMLVLVEAAVTDVEARVAKRLRVLPLVSMLPAVCLTANVGELSGTLGAQLDALAALDSLIDSRAIHPTQIPLVSDLVARLQATTGHLNLCWFASQQAMAVQTHRAMS